MTRFASATNSTEAAKNAVRIFVAADLDFSSGHVRVHDGIGDIVWGGNTFSGIGQFGNIEVVGESIEIIARSISLSLSGVDSSLVSTTMTEVYQNRSATIYIGFVSESTGAVVDTPETVWEGRMNQMSISSSSGAASIRLTCEHRLRREPRIARYTNEDQQLLFPGDRFFDLVPSIKGFVAKWGDASVGGMGSWGGWSGRGSGALEPWWQQPVKEARN
jgi:hypothetical protein